MNAAPDTLQAEVERLVDQKLGRFIALLEKVVIALKDSQSEELTRLSTELHQLIEALDPSSPHHPRSKMQ